MIPSYVDRYIHAHLHFQGAISFSPLLFLLLPQIPLLYLAVRIPSHSDKKQLQRACGKVVSRITLTTAKPDITRQLLDV